MPGTKYLCIISIQKVQSYLFDAIQSHEQEKQTDYQTLLKVKQASRSISEEFFDVVSGKFGEEMLDVYIGNQSYKALPSGSGCIMFVINADALNMSDPAYSFNMRLVDFFNDQYKKHKAAMRISYATTALEENKHYNINDGKIVLTDIVNESIKEVKKQLKNPATNNQIIESSVKNHAANKSDDALDIFSFHRDTGVTSDSRRYQKEAESRTHDELSIAKLLENLRPSTKSLHSHKEGDPARFYIAYIKADLCGMGDSFESVSTLDGYIKMSQMLTEYISIDKLESYFRKTQIRFYPIYAAGDDIFIAVCVNDIPTAVDRLASLLRDINSKLRSENVTKKSADVSLPVQLAMRLVIDITWGNQPIRYYYTRTENQMESCRQEKPNSILVGSGYTQICIGDMVFWNVDKDSIVDTKYISAREHACKYEQEKAALRKSYPEYETSQRKYYNMALEKIKKRLVEDSDPSVKSKTYEYYSKLDELLLADVLPLWDDFISDVRLINMDISGPLHSKENANDIGSDEKRSITASYLYNLLSVLDTDSNYSEKENTHYTNILYRLMPPKIQSSAPRYIEDVSKKVIHKQSEKLTETDCQLIEEAVIWHVVASLLIDTNKTINLSGRNKTTKKAKVPPASSLENASRYIKLLLLASDPRISFRLEKHEEKALKGRITSALGDLQDYYTAFLDALFELGKQHHQNILNVFIKKQYGLSAIHTSGSSTYSGYITLSLVEKSMLFKFKSLLQQKSIYAQENVDILAKIAQAIENKKSTWGISERLKQEEQKSTPVKPGERKNRRLRNSLNHDFAAELFLGKSKFFTPDFIDMLIVFYSHLELRRKCKSFFGAKKEQEGLISAYIKYHSGDKI